MSLFPPHLLTKARAILEICTARGWKMATAESCTGGLLSGILTELPGSSAMFTHGFVTYANEAKAQMVGVDAWVIAHHGAVSVASARALAEGALKESGADLSLSVTGIAGPSGATAGKPVGTVHFACAIKNRPTVTQHKIFAGDRSEVRLQAVDAALDIAIAELNA